MIFNKKKYLPYGRHTVTKEDLINVLNVLRSSNLTQGDKVPLLEKAISEKVNCKNSIAVNSATSALHLTCLALGLNQNDWLWTSANTFVASANCGRYCNAKVDFVDINPKTGLICTDALEKKLEVAKENNKLPKILVPVHFAGSSCDMEKIASLSKKYKFNVVEDASHALGGKYKNEPVGSCFYSIATIFSFHPVKIITTAEGGAITTNDDQLAKKLFLLRSHGITKVQEEFESNEFEDWTYEQQILGFNFRMSDLHASLGISQLKRLDKIIVERNKKFEYYQDLIKELPINLLEIPKNVKSSVHLAIIRLQEKDPNLHRKIFTELRKMNIGVQIHYLPVHLHPYYKKLGFKVGDYPKAELHSKNCITIPLYLGMDKKDQNRVVKSLKSLL